MWFTKLTRHQFWSRLRWCRGLGEKCSRKSCLFLRACPRLWCPGTWSTGSGAGGWPKPRHPRPQRPGHTSEKIFQTDPPVKEQTFSKKIGGFRFLEQLETYHNTKKSVQISYCEQFWGQSIVPLNPFDDIERCPHFRTSKCPSSLTILASLWMLLFLNNNL